MFPAAPSSLGAPRQGNGAKAAPQRASRSANPPFGSRVRRGWGDRLASLSFPSSVIKAQLELSQSAWWCHCCSVPPRLRLPASCTKTGGRRWMVHRLWKHLLGEQTAGITQRWQTHSVNDLLLVFLHPTAPICHAWHDYRFICSMSSTVPWRLNHTSGM